MSNQITIPGIALFAPFPVQPDDDRAKAAPIEVAEPDAPEQSASEPTLTLTLPEVRELVAAAVADERARAAQANAGNVLHDAGNRTIADRTAKALANPEAALKVAQANVGASVAGKRKKLDLWVEWGCPRPVAAPRAPSGDGVWWSREGLPIRMTLAETGGPAGRDAAASERRRDAAASWDAAIKRLGK